MRAIDEILATGWYTDKRGREWHHSAFLPRWVTSSGFNYFGPVYAFVYEAEMRLLIERDQHRDVCPGLNLCSRHPVPRVLIRYRWSTDAYFIAIGPGYRSGGTHDTLAEAMDGGYELAVQP